MVDILYPEYNLYGWTYVWFGTADDWPTTYETEEDARQFMEWIKDWCATADEVEDIDVKHFKLKKK